MGTLLRHMNITCFFITNRVKEDLLSIECCGIDDMIADFFTKSIQAAKFKKFWAAIKNKKID